MKLKEYLDLHRITYRAFAEKLGIYTPSLQNIAYGVKKPSLDLAVKIEELTEGQVTPREVLLTFNKINVQTSKRKTIKKNVKRSEDV